ncbi:hypothetical protein LINPERPRIM_LOCUS33752 [Linum perenne]
MLRCELEVEWSMIHVVGNCASVQCEWYGRCVSGSVVSDSELYCDEMLNCALHELAISCTCEWVTWVILLRLLVVGLSCAHV